jgi:hypothetical protein
MSGGRMTASRATLRPPLRLGMTHKGRLEPSDGREANGRKRRYLAVRRGVDEGRVSHPFADLHHRAMQTGVQGLRARKPPDGKLD